MTTYPADLPLLIIKTGETFAHLSAPAGDFEHWVEAGVAGHGLPVAVVDARQPGGLPAPHTIAGAVLTGSHAMVSDRADWSEALGTWLATAVQQQTPVLGICYGHQLLAHALGGEVGYHPGGLEIGTVEVTRTPHAADDVLLGALPGRFAAQVVHHQSVRALPPGAVPLAGNAHEPHHAYRIGERAWGVQFHPEFSADAMRCYIDTLAPSLSDAGRDVQALRTGVRDTPDAAALLGRFARLCSAPAG